MPNSVLKSPCWLSAFLAFWTLASPARADRPGTWPHALRNTAAIVEADVTELSYTYDDHRGPRTVATLKNMTCHRGALPAYDKLELSTMGGPLPSGEFLHVTHTPQFVVGSRVLVFLTNKPWLISQVYADSWVYTIMQHNGRKLLVHDDGTAVVSIGLGPERGSPLATFADLASAARNVPPSGVAAARSALDVKQLLDGIDAAGRQYGLTVSGALDMHPTVPPTGWNILPEQPVAALCDEPLRSEEQPEKLVCDGGAP
jgi:hypothetical protein